MALITAVAVLLTLALVLTPVYIAGRRKLTQLNAHRLSAIAASASVAIPPESLDVIATRGQNTGAFVFVREVLKRTWAANGGDTRQLTNGIAIVRHDGNDYRYLAHSSWNAGQPQYSREWTPPASLRDSLSRNVSG